MPTRDRAPAGSPCWVDLWTSDVEGSRRFYSELLGWEAEEPNPDFGGYFMFTRHGVPVAGGMGDMGPDMPANNTWKVYLTTEDIEQTVAAAPDAGAELMGPTMPVADLGIQAVLVDPTGAVIGAWQPGTFPGFTVLGEPGAPSWFELHTRDHAAAVAFYQLVFHWKTAAIGDTDEFRYATMQDPAGEGQLAGIMDASGFLPEGTSPYWTVYWGVESTDAAAAKAETLGGAVVASPETTPYGRVATVADPSGAQFRLHMPNQ